MDKYFMKRNEGASTWVGFLIEDIADAYASVAEFLNW